MGYYGCIGNSEAINSLEPSLIKAYNMNTMDLIKLAALIHNKREELGIPLLVAARKAGISKSTLGIIEHAENPRTGKPSRPARHILERLAPVLHMSQEELNEVLTLADYTVTSQVSQPLASDTKKKEQPQPPLPPPVPVVTLDNDKVYVYANESLQAYDKKTGDRLWFSPASAGDIVSAALSVPASYGHADVTDIKNILASLPQRLIEQLTTELRKVIQEEVWKMFTVPPATVEDSSEQAVMQGCIFVLSGISGRENNAVITCLKKQNPDLFISPIITTRERHKDERQISHLYRYLSENDFNQRKKKKQLLTYFYNRYIPNRAPAWYGHGREVIKEALHRGKDIIVQAGPEEVVQIRHEYPAAILILLRPPQEVRSGEEHKRWNDRIQQIKDDYHIEYGYIVDFTDVQHAADKIRNIILSEHKKS